MGTSPLLLAGYVTDLDAVGSYLICATPRTGSTLLCGLLSDTGIAGEPESYFRLQDERSYAERWSVPVGPGGPHDYREYARAALAAGSTTNGVFAARVMWGTMEEVVAKLRAAYVTGQHRPRRFWSRSFGRTRLYMLNEVMSWPRPYLGRERSRLTTGKTVTVPQGGCRSSTRTKSMPTSGPSTRTTQRGVSGSAHAHRAPGCDLRRVVADMSGTVATSP